MSIGLMKTAVTIQGHIIEFCKYGHTVSRLLLLFPYIRDCFVYILRFSTSPKIPEKELNRAELTGN